MERLHIVYNNTNKVEEVEEKRQLEQQIVYDNADNPEKERLLYGNIDNPEKEGRLEQLPEGVLQHILFYLGRKDAAQVGMLSKTLYDVWSLQPILKVYFNPVQKNQGDVEEEEATNIEKDREGFINYLNKSLERYLSQNRCPQQLYLTIECGYKPSLPSLMERLLGDIEESGVPAIHLNFCTLERVLFYQTNDYYPDLFRVLERKTLVELNARNCQFNQQSDKRVVRCSLLKKLSLEYFDMDDTTLRSIILTCPILEKLILRGIKGLKRFKVVNLYCLKEFFVSLYECKEGEGEVEVEAPSLENVSLQHFKGQFKLHPSNHLKKLTLERVNIPEKFLKNLADHFPKLEDFSLWFGEIFGRFKIESKSLKFLSMKYNEEHGNIPEIDAPNLISFEYNGSLIPCFNSMKTITTSSTRKCHIELQDAAWQDSEWFIELKEMLKKLIQFKITLSIEGGVYDDDEISSNSTMELGVEVEDMWLVIRGLSSLSEFEYSTVLGNLFRSCRPKSIGFSWRGDSDKPFFEFLCQRLMNVDRNPNDNEFPWKDGLKEAKIDMIDISDVCEYKQIVASVDCKTFIEHLSNFLLTQ